MKTINKEEITKYLELNSETLTYKLDTLNVLEKLVHRYSSLLVNHYENATSYIVKLTLDDWGMANSNVTFETLLKDKSNNIIMKISLTTYRYFYQYSKNEDGKYFSLKFSAPHSQKYIILNNSLKEKTMTYYSINDNTRKQGFDISGNKSELNEFISMNDIEMTKKILSEIYDNKNHCKFEPKNIMVKTKKSLDNFFKEFKSEIKKSLGYSLKRDSENNLFFKVKFPKKTFNQFSTKSSISAIIKEKVIQSVKNMELTYSFSESSTIPPSYTYGNKDLLTTYVHFDGDFLVIKFVIDKYIKESKFIDSNMFNNVEYYNIRSIRSHLKA